MASIADTSDRAVARSHGPKVVGISALLGALGACSSETDMPRSGQVPTVNGGGISLRDLSALIEANGGSPILATDADGREWSVKRAAFAPDASSTTSDAPREPSMAPSQGLDALNAVDAAERMRAVRLVGELEFTELHANVARTLDARSRNEAGMRLRADPHDPSRLEDPDTTNIQPNDVAGSARVAISSRAHFGDWADLLQVKQSSHHPFASQVVPTERNPLWRLFGPPEDGLDTPQGIQGLYTRSWVTTVWGWPHGAIVKHTPSMSSQFAGGGTATLIGRRTAIGAAHSFHNGITWNPTREWAADIIRYAPLGGATVSEIVFGVYYGCYTVTIPNGYITTGGATEEDFAVIEFTCGLSPGNFTGWIPGGVGHSADIELSNTYLEGYDYATPIPSPLSGGRVYAAGSMLTRYGSAYSARVMPGRVSVLQHWLDTTGGSSGSGLLKNLFASVGDGTYYWAGVHKGGNNSSYNEGRRNDWGLWYFITDNTTEW